MMKNEASNDSKNVCELKGPNTRANTLNLTSLSKYSMSVTWFKL